MTLAFAAVAIPYREVWSIDLEENFYIRMLCSSCLPCCANCVRQIEHLLQGHGVHRLSHFTTAYDSWLHASDYGGYCSSNRSQVSVCGYWIVVPRPLPVNVNEDYVCDGRAL